MRVSSAKAQASGAPAADAALGATAAAAAVAAAVASCGGADGAAAGDADQHGSVAAAPQRYELDSAGKVAIAVSYFRARAAAAAAPDGPGLQALVLASAAGVQQAAYRRFAAWAAGQGVHVYSFDCRGIGASRPARLRGFDANFGHWVHDIETVLQHALQQHSRVAFLGHSVGGLLGPLAPSAVGLQSLLLVGTQTAYWCDWPLPQRWPMAALWHLLMPLATALLGYFPGRALRLGEDLPRGVALQWARRPWQDPFAEADFSRALARPLPPLHLLAASDDPFATPAALDRLQARLTGSPVQRHIWQPASLGLHRIGHFDLFRPRCAPLWPALLQLLQQPQPQPQQQQPQQQQQQQPQPQQQQQQHQHQQQPQPHPPAPRPGAAPGAVQTGPAGAAKAPYPARLPLPSRPRQHHNPETSP